MTDQLATRLSADQIDTLRGKHQEHVKSGSMWTGSPGYCTNCMLPYPCIIASLITEVDHLRGRMTILEDEFISVIEDEHGDELVREARVWLDSPTLTRRL